MARVRAVAMLAAACCASPWIGARAQEPAAFHRDTLPPRTTTGAPRSRISVAGTTRSYHIGDSTVTERVANVRYELGGGGFRLRLDGTALRFATRTDTIEGALPFSVRLDRALRPGDTLSVFLRTASRPQDLTNRQTAALGSVGTSTIDLESAGFGSPAVGGARVATAYPVGDLVLATRVAFELEPRPSNALPVYWTGSTLRAGVTLTSAGENGALSGMLDASYSRADSLDGRNLYPGGGSMSLQIVADGSVPNPLDPLQDERWPLRGVAFYSRPFRNDRSDQPTLLIPQGSVVGAFGTVLVSIGALTVAPTLQLLRESSSSESTSGLVRSRVAGSAWTAQPSLDVVIPLGDRFELTPQLGYTVGSVGAAFSQTAVRRGRVVGQGSSFSDAIRGQWVSVQLSAIF